jgi:hypothetical protein
VISSGDDELRSLQRLVDENAAAVADRVRYGRLLVRAGRREEALEVLLPARDDADVRHELGTFPAWTHRRGDRGRSAWVDVAPLAPDRKWGWESPVTPVVKRPTSLLASPLAIVVLGRPGLAILDPDTGKARASLPHALDALIEQDRLVVANPESFSIHDLASGERLAATPAAQDLEPRLEAATSRTILVSRGRDLVALDRSTGADRWTARGASKPLADENGVVVHAGDDLRLLDPDGRLVRSRANATAKALTPRSVVARDGSSRKALVIDRRSGAVRAMAPLLRGPCAVARDVAFAREASGDLVAFSLEGGQVLWRWNHRRRWPIAALAPTRRRVYVLVGAGAEHAVACLRAGRER